MRVLTLLHNLLTFCITSSLATPAPAEQGARRDPLLASLVNNVDSAVSPVAVVISTALTPVESAVPSLASAVTLVALPLDTSVIDDIRSVTATATIDDVEAASSALSSIILATPTPTNIYGLIENFVEAGLFDNNVDSILNATVGFLEGMGSWNNSNPINPEHSIYPQADSLDVIYDLSEQDLRAAIYIPSSFRYGAAGAPKPIILVPGTGDTGYGTFLGSYIPLLQGSHIADPVWLNIPINLLSDAQNNAEFVAYAINYISAISGGTQVSVAAWSQGNINSQWAYKFWPSARKLVTDHIAFSPDYHGTVLANSIATPGEPLPPAVLQQEYNSQYITRLREQNGDSAFVPTTTVYSGFYDEIVEPQQGSGASAYLLDERGVGVTNNEVQQVCAGQAAGTFYLHEGILYNPLGYYLLVDALSNDGPGRIERLDLGAVCNNYLTPGLDLADLFLTEIWLLVVGFNLVTYPYPVFDEPDIKPQYNASYAESISNTYS